MPEKKCFKCKKTKPIDEFYKHIGMADGHLNKCIDCAVRDAKARYADPESRQRIREYERQRFLRPERKDRIREYQRRRRATNRGKFVARNAVSNAVRDGRLLRKSCERCGNTKSQAHHDDYRRKLSVRWLCFKHHREAHGQIVG